MITWHACKQIKYFIFLVSALFWLFLFFNDLLFKFDIYDLIISSSSTAEPQLDSIYMKQEYFKHNIWQKKKTLRFKNHKTIDKAVQNKD